MEARLVENYGVDGIVCFSLFLSTFNTAPSTSNHNWNNIGDVPISSDFIAIFGTYHPRSTNGMEADRRADTESTVDFPLKLWFAQTRREEMESEDGCSSIGESLSDVNPLYYLKPFFNGSWTTTI